MIYILETTWQQWIEDNIARGCNKADMLNVMIEAGIDKETAAFNLTLFEACQHPKSNTSDAKAHITKTLQKNSVQDGGYLLQRENNLQTSDGHVMHVSMRCQSPDVVLLDGFMTEEECDALCKLSMDKLTTSTVVDDKTGAGVNHQARTSKGAYFSIGQYPLVKTIEKRISEITGTPIINGEGLQILNYANGGEYKPHFDYFPNNKGGHANMQQGGQRIITIVMYLNDVISGGATIFPEINLDIYPKKGSALYFSYFSHDGKVDPLTLHGGAPVVEGEKWIATKWIRQNAYN